MVQTSRIGIQIIPSEPYWVQVGLAIEQEARKLAVELIPVDIDNLKMPEADYPGLVEEIVAQEIQALIILDLPEAFIRLLLAQNVPIISMVEQLESFKLSQDETRLVSPLGLRQIAHTLAGYVMEKLPQPASVLVVGGMTLDMGGSEGVGEDGRSLVYGIFDIFKTSPAIQLTHIPTSWSYDWAYPEILAGMQKLAEPLDAIISVSDTLALESRTIAGNLGLLKPTTIIAGINGDPQALAAIAEGIMDATIALSTTDFARQVIELSVQASTGAPLPRHFSLTYKLITQENVTEIAAQKLSAIAELPNLLVGVNRQREKQRLIQLETSLAINQQIGAILDRQVLTRTIVDLIRTNYNYDRVHLYLWSESEQVLVLDDQTSEQQIVAEDGLPLHVWQNNELVSVPDMQHSQRFSPDPAWPSLRSRVVLPVRLGSNVLGVLDLQRDLIAHHSREQLMSLQLLADQLAIAIQNAKLYSEALTARRLAEKADQLKTRLLANVSHELRTPLNIILGYTKSALMTPNRYGITFPDELISDLSSVYRSGEHLTHLINDLLDLSRAEIDELEIFPRLIEIGPFLEEVFHNIADAPSDHDPVEWHFNPQPNLPLIQADPIRLRQILLNLLSNAKKFTRQGHITLGVELQLPFIHIWVEDTGSGISSEQQSNIFEPFIVGGNSERHAGGIGLGLTITRRLIALHRGIISMESSLNKGSTFHVYLPLPNLSGQLLTIPPVKSTEKLVLVSISTRSELPPEIKVLSQQNNVQLFQLRPELVMEHLLELEPSILAWDTSSLDQKDWQIMSYLRNTPSLNQLPLILFSSAATLDEKSQTGTTNILLKPLNGQTLQSLLEALRPHHKRDGILIVDDDVESLDMYQQLVQNTLPDMAIYRAESGSEALEMLKEFIPDLIIVDVVMPEVDGCDVVEWVRFNPATQHVPVLVITGKVLTAEQIERLDFARVVLHTKGILQIEEASSLIKQVIESTQLLPQYYSTLMKRAIIYLQNNYAQELSVQKIAQEIGISRSYLARKFHQELGVSPWEYLNRYRIKEAKHLLKTTDLIITEVASKVGFDDPAYFSRIFKAYEGQSPKEYRNSPV